MTNKRYILLALVTFATVMVSWAQNVQLHYDFGSVLYDQLDKEKRPDLTSTVEMFKPDKWGSTFFFIDMDYSSNGVEQAYWEISRELRLWKAPVALHVEYNGGLNYINNAYLVGVAYNWNSEDLQRGWALQALYKYIEHNDRPNNFQLTATWYLHFSKGKFSFNGYADFWKEKHTDIDGNDHGYTFMSEPQFWMNFNKFKGIDPDFNLSLGTEWELTQNFALKNGFYCIPTIALKWTFN